MVPPQRGLGIRLGMGECRAVRETCWIEGKLNICNQRE